MQQLYSFFSSASHQVMPVEINHSTSVFQYWVFAGAFSGAMISAIDKLCKIASEKESEYTYPLIEKPIKVVYHISRIAAHAGFGAAVAGITAATAPISIPLYVYYKSLPPVVRGTDSKDQYHVDVHNAQ